jgi:Membrane proteins related to metalloendopeptidases
MAALDSGIVLPPMSSPLRSFSHARVGASVGERINPFYKVPVQHGGLDMIAQMGEDVVAAAPGIVSSVVRSGKGLGNVVEITHAAGYVTRYAHLDAIRVAKGQRVAKGGLIGKVGVSGNSFAPHLHYEVQKDGVKVDPVNYFFASTPPADYMEMLYMSANARQSMD